MNLFAIAGLSTSIFCFVLAIIALIYGRTKLHYLLVEFNILVGIWGFGTFLVGRATSASAALFVWKVAISAAIFIPVLFYHMVCVFSRLQRRKIVILIYLQSFIFSYLCFFTNLAINRTRFVFNSIFYPFATPFFYLIFLVWLLIVYMSFFELFKSLKSALGDTRKQTLYLFFGFLIGFIGGTSVNLPTFGINIYPLGNFTIPVYCLIVTYAILRHRLMDIKIGITRTAIYTMIFVAVVGIPIGFLFMNFFTLSGLLTGTCCSLLALVALSYGKAKIHWILALFNLSVAIWGYGCFWVGRADTESTALIGWRFAQMGGIFIAVFFYHMICTFCELRRRKPLITVYLWGLFFLYFCFFTNLLFAKTCFIYGVYYNEATWLYALLVFSWLFVVCLSFFELLRFLPKTTGIKRTQTLYIILGFLTGFIGGSSTLITMFGINFPPFGNFTIPIYCLIATYAILRYSLMDIRVAITRAGLFGVVYALVLGVPFALGWWGRDYFSVRLGIHWWLIPTGACAILSSVGPFIYLYFQRRAENIIRKEQLEYQEKLRATSSTIMLNKDLDKLLKVMVLNAVDIVKVEWAGIYLKDEKQSKYLLKHYRHRTTRIDLPKEFPDNSDFVGHLYKSRLPLIGEEIPSQELKVGLAVPCFIDSNMIGFLLLGDKPNNKIYDQSDINEFTLLANQAALAIENCQFYSQERQHQQFLRLASLDRQMADMAHELDNPNQAMLGILGSLELTLDDIKDVVPPDKMEYAKKKMGRLRFNIGRVSSMISSVREFSKTTTGELKPTKFEWIMEGFLNIVGPQFKYNGIDFIKEVTGEVIWLRANKVEIEQVLVNLGTNSVQAINEIWQRGENIPESKKEISLKAYKIDSTVLRIDFSDTGSGIEKEILEQIFLDFVTTKGSAEGTGLGLSISRKTIQKHGGKIWVESEGKNKGASFHIELPIANDIIEEEKIQAEKDRGKANKKDMFREDFLK